MLDVSVIGALAVNASMSIALAVVLALLPARPSASARMSSRLLAGLIVAGLTVTAMATSVELIPGLQFDVRSVILGLSGWFLGATPTLMAIGFASLFRFAQGGGGTVHGIIAIVVSGLLGLAFRRWRKPEESSLRVWDLVGFGLLLHVLMAALLATLPRPLFVLFARDALLPIFVIYPAVTVIVGRLLLARIRSDQNVEALVESEHRFRHMFERGHAVMLLVDPNDGAIVDANPAAEEYYGWSKSELMAASVYEINTAPKEEIDAALRRVAAARRTSLAHQHRRADGSVRHVNVFSGPVELDGRALLYSVIVDDQEIREATNERIRLLEEAAIERMNEADDQRNARRAAMTLARETLRDQTRLTEALGRLELLLEHAPTALAMFDSELRFVVVSRRFLTTFGLEDEDEDVDGRLLTSVLPDVPPSIVEAHERALKGLVADSDEELVHRKGGKPTFQRWATRPWHGVDGEIGGMILFTEDVTEWVAARTRITTLAQAVEQSPDSIFVTDLEGTIEYVNTAFVEATGYSLDEVLGENPRILNSGKTPKSHYRRMWDAITHGRVWTGELINKHKDGRDLYQLATVSPVTGPHGVVRHYVAVQEDITEKKRLGWELDRYRDHLEALVFDRTRELEEAREQAEVANRTKSAFLSNVTHEIRTPLNAIIGMTHLLNRDEATPEQQIRLETVDQAAHQLLKMMNAIVDIARIDAGDRSLDESDFALGDVTEHVRSLVEGAAVDKGLELVVDAGTVPVLVRGDVGRLRQALHQLAENAVRFTNAGRVSIVASVQEASSRSLVVRFDVADTGIGLASEDQERVFEAFEQADMSTTRSLGGAGVGLALARRLAQLMGGDIETERLPTGGTVFSLSVRLERGRQVPSTFDAGDDLVLESATPTTLKARVLVADDDEISLEVARRRLERLGFEVDTAPNGRIAVEKVRDTSYGLILLDLQMPELDGRGACREIRDMPERHHVRIVALSGSDDEEEARACLAAGMDGFLTKPLDASRLRELLTAWGSAERVAPSEADPSTPPAHGCAARRPPTDVATTVHPDDSELEAGLAVVGGDIERYRHLLGVFAAAHQGDVRLVEEASASGHLDHALTRLHSLKGAASSLGQVRLAQVASRIERRAKEAGEVSELELRSLKRELEALSLRILDLSRTTAPEMPQADDLGASSPEDADDVLASLEGLVGSDDADAPRYLARHRATLRSAYGNDVDRLVDAIDAYDYETARSMLEKLRM